MKSSLAIFCLLALVSCGPRRPGHHGVDGKNGKDGLSMGIHLQDADELVCSNGGVVLSTFSDLDSDATLDSDEPIKSIKTVCNGTNGQDGEDGENGQDGQNGTNGTSASISLDTIPSGAACSNGGIMISSSTSSPVVVCNGKNGLNGAQGLQGIQGLPGIQGPMGPQGPAGVNGSTVVPVKFCPSSNATYPEYGLKIGNDIFAVFWNGQAFMTKLVTGTYRTTTGSQDCNFSI